MQMPFYEALRKDNISQILNQSNIKTIFIAEKYVQLLVDLKKEGVIERLKILVIIGEISLDMKKLSQEAGFQVYRYNEITYEGKKHPSQNAIVTQSSVASFSYTSGSTGKPRAVMISHGNMIAALNGLQKSYFINPTI